VRAALWGLLTPISAALVGMIAYLAIEGAAILYDHPFDAVFGGLVLCAAVGASVGYHWNDEGANGD